MTGLGRRYGMKLAPVVLGVLWLWWVLKSLKDDIATLRTGEDKVPKVFIVLVWALTLGVIYVMWWCIWQLIVNGRAWYE